MVGERKSKPGIMTDGDGERGDDAAAAAAAATATAILEHEEKKQEFEQVMRNIDYCVSCTIVFARQSRVSLRTERH